MIDNTVAQVFDIPFEDLNGASRGKARVAFARQVGMYLAHVACQLNFTEVGELFGRDRTTVAHACGLVEDSRDDAMMDRVLELLEVSVLSLLDLTPAPRAR